MLNGQALKCAVVAAELTLLASTALAAPAPAQTQVEQVTVTARRWQPRH